GPVVGPDLREDHRDRHRHRRNDEPCRDRVPRVRVARRDRNRFGLDHHPHRSAHPRRRQRGPRRDPGALSSMSLPSNRTPARTVLVTGAAGGLGRAFALGFADRGYRVAVADLDADGAEETARQVKDAGVDAWHGHVDVTDPASTEQLAVRVAEFGGGTFDVLVNNAAVYGAVTRSPLEDIDPAEWDLVMGVNLKGPWLMTRAASPHLPE